MHIKQILTWKGTIGRQDYLIWGALLFAIKYNLDRLIANQYQKSWFITDYFRQVDTLAITSLSAEEQEFYLVLLALALPFIWIGTVLCKKRLEDAGLSNWLVLLFFIPFLNLVLFIILAALPSNEQSPNGSPSFLERLIPKNDTGSILLALGIVTIVCLLLTYFFVNNLEQYGWSMFVGIPFLLGFLSVLISGYHRTISIKLALLITTAATCIFCAVVLVLAFEGFLCIAMAFPILLIISLFGGVIGWAITFQKNQARLNVILAPIALVVIIGILEPKDSNGPPIIAVTTSVEIEANKQQVWDHLINFSTINAPNDWIFKTGIAYPTHAEIKGTGVGAIRECYFTTGAFVEPITQWDAPNLLAFSVDKQPPPMVELSFYDDLEIAHLDAYFESQKGQFKLTSSAHGNTLLEGTTWYKHNIWPNFYWRIWSDFILHRIHNRVLEHIKLKAEA